MVVNPMIQIQKSPLTNPRSTVRNPSHANQNPHKTHAAPSAQGSRSGEHESCSEQKKGTKPSSNLKPTWNQWEASRKKKEQQNCVLLTKASWLKNIQVLFVDWPKNNNFGVLVSFWKGDFEKVTSWPQIMDGESFFEVPSFCFNTQFPLKKPWKTMQDKSKKEKTSPGHPLGIDKKIWNPWIKGHFQKKNLHVCYNQFLRIIWVFPKIGVPPNHPY